MLLLSVPETITKRFVFILDKHPTFLQRRAYKQEVKNSVSFVNNKQVYKNVYISAEHNGLTVIQYYVLNYFFDRKLSYMKVYKKRNIFQRYFIKTLKNVYHFRFKVVT